MKNIAKFSSLSALLVMFLFSGAAAAYAQKSGPPQKGSPTYESWLKNEVRHQLVMLPWYSVFDNLEYSVDGYNVTLEGQVTQPILKSEAESAVKHIEGVEQVTNNIEVLPLSTMDEQIRRAEYRAIFGFAPLFRYSEQAVPPIHIIVKNGHVTLVGVVSSEGDKNAAGIRAKIVPNVFSVTNNLKVDSSM
jgi:osmotically-inducible protein OsmY